MADKPIAFSDKDQFQIHEMLIDNDKKAALKFIAHLMDQLKGHAGHVCGFRPFK